ILNFLSIALAWSCRRLPCPGGLKASATGSGVFQWRLRVVDPKLVVDESGGAAIDLEIAEGGPGHREAGGAARHNEAVHALGEEPLDVIGEGAALLHVCFETGLFDQRVDLRVARFVVLAARTEALESDTAVGPVLGRSEER